jgi:hypothetical protein
MARGLSSWVVDGSSSVAHVIGHLADRKVQSWSGRTALSVDAWLPMSARFNIHSKLFKYNRQIFVYCIYGKKRTSSRIAYL